MPCRWRGSGRDDEPFCVAQSDWGKMPACYAVAHGSSPRPMSGFFFRCREHQAGTGNFDDCRDPNCRAPTDDSV
jgi:hypothetical protein